MSRNGVRADDLLKMVFVSDPQISPDGRRAIYVQRTINADQKYESHLYMVDLIDHKVVRFTQGTANDTAPRWSPDGERIAFVSDRSGKKQIWVIPTAGGEAKQLTYCKNGVWQAPVWSPDGRHLLTIVPIAKGERLEDLGEEIGEAKEDKKKDRDEPYVVDRLKYKSDAEGFFRGKYKQLALVHVEDGTITTLTTGECDHSGACFSPDGKRIAFAANRADDPDRQLISDIYEMTLATKKWTLLTRSDGVFMSPNYSPCGRRLSVLGHRKEYMGATLTRVWVIDRETKHMSCLTEDWDVEASDVAINDMGTAAENRGAVWSQTGEALYFLASEAGSTGLYEVTLDRKVKRIIGGARQIYAFSLDHQKRHGVLAVSNYQTPGDLVFVRLEDGKEERLTEANAHWLHERTLSVPESFTFAARDGLMLHGWIMKPVGFEEGHQYPLILEIHGGPHAMYSHAFMHEFQVLAGLGYGVLFINPRGSHGYGQSFVDAVRGDYGGSDYHDLMDAVDYAMKHHRWIDAERLGVTGGSYGGFMTNWIVGHTNKFKAAVTQRSITNWLSFYGVSDIGYYFTEWELKGNLIDHADKLWRHSPLRYVKNIETPLLILHSEKDYRCPIEQAEQLYVALKQQRKTTRFVRFPNANHELSRSGDPSLRLARLREITRWFDQYLV